MCVRSGTQEETTSFRCGVLGCEGRSENWDTGLLKARKHLAQHRLVLEEMAREQTGEMWALSQTLVQESDLQQPCAVHLHVCLGTKHRGPTLGFFSVAGRAASDRADLEREGQREAGSAGRSKGTRECTGQQRKNVLGVELALTSFGTQGFAEVFVCLATASRSRMCSLAGAPPCFSHRGSCRDRNSRRCRLRCRRDLYIQLSLMRAVAFVTWSAEVISVL